MTADSPDEKPPAEDRLMALLALNSQELPAHRGLPEELLLELDEEQADPARLEALHAYLDDHPEAFEAFLQRHRRSGSMFEATAAAPKRRALRPRWLTWKIAPLAMPLRYAVASCVAIVCAVFVIHLFIGRSTPVATAIEAGYADLATQLDASQALEVASSRDERGAQLGFSLSNSGASPQASAFASGVGTGRRRIIEQHSFRGTDASSPDESIYYTLGEWNVLLWTAARSERPLPASFWQAQRQRHQIIVAALAKSRDPDSLVVSHLQRVDTLLLDLAQQNRATRASRALAEELQLFRGQFAPGNASH